MFGEIEMFHQKSSDKAMESFHKGKPLKRKLAKFDIFNLHSFIPRKFYVFLNRLFNFAVTEDLTPEDYPIRKVDGSTDKSKIRLMVALCKK